jgi:tetratricopeptide (TPR) repeat protein
VEELYLVGLHLEQYRHPALAPEPYWEEALRRDAGDARSHVGLGRAALRKGDFSQAEEHFRAAVKRLTWRNYNPPDGDVHYYLGLSLQYQERLDEAYKAFYKATWAYAWKSPGYYSLAQIDCLRQDFAQAQEHLERSLQANPQNSKARNLLGSVLRRRGEVEAAGEWAAETLAMDMLDHWARYELAQASHDIEELARLKQMMRGDVQTILDIAFDYANAGFWQEASDFLSLAAGETTYPMVAYAAGYFARQMGRTEQAAAWYARGAQAEPDYCFPWRLEEMQVLRDVLANNPDDGRACYYLGNLLYDKKQYAEAAQLWMKAVEVEPDFAIPWRNLGLAAYNRHQDIDHALECFEKAWQANPGDPRLLLEYDQLRRRKGVSPEERLALFEKHLEVVKRRDDLVIEWISLYNRVGQPQKALEISAGHAFHAWEGGEGKVAVQHANAHWLLGRQALEAGNATLALEHLTQGLEFPANLGVTPFDLETIHVLYYKGLAQSAAGKAADAQTTFEQVLAMPGWMHAAYYQALALRQLGREPEAEEKLRSMRTSAAALAEEGSQPNYFFSGKPSPIFEDDARQYNRPTFLTAVGLAQLGLGDITGAKNTLAQVLALAPANLLAYEEWKRL